MKLRKGDEVIVTAGKDKGKKGNIEKIYAERHLVLVPGINMYKKHVKPQGQKKPGGILDTVRPLPVTNVALICQNCGKPTRVGIQVSKNGDGEKKRICRKCGKNI